MRQRLFRLIVFRIFLISALLCSVVLIYGRVNARSRGSRSPVTVRQPAADGAVIKAVPVYPDEREKDARERLLASVECPTYDILDEGTSPSLAFKTQSGESYYLYVTYRCMERAVG